MRAMAHFYCQTVRPGRTNWYSLKSLNYTKLAYFFLENTNLQWNACAFVLWALLAIYAPQNVRHIMSAGKTGLLLSNIACTKTCMVKIVSRRDPLCCKHINKAYIYSNVQRQRKRINIVTFRRIKILFKTFVYNPRRKSIYLNKSGSNLFTAANYIVGTFLMRYFYLCKNTIYLYTYTVWRSYLLYRYIIRLL